MGIAGGDEENYCKTGYLPITNQQCVSITDLNCLVFLPYVGCTQCPPNSNLIPNFVVAAAPSSITGCSAIDSEEEVTAITKIMNMKWIGRMNNKRKMMMMNILKQKKINGMKIKKLNLKMKKQRKLLELEPVLDMQIDYY